MPFVTASRAPTFDESSRAGSAAEWDRSGRHDVARGAAEHDLIAAGRHAPVVRGGTPVRERARVELEMDGRGRPGGERDFLKAFQRLRSEEHTSELQSPYDLVCRLLLEK